MKLSYYLLIATFLPMLVSAQSLEDLPDAPEAWTPTKGGYIAFTGNGEEVKYIHKDDFTISPTFKVVSGPMYLDWNSNTTVLNHPVTDEPVAAPLLANEFFEALKVTLEIKTDLESAQELLMFILGRIELNKVQMEVLENGESNASK